MIEIAHEQLVPIRDVPRHLPRRPNNKKIHVSVCYRWVSRGVRGVKLDAVRVGGTTYTSLEALQRFADALSVTIPSAPTEMKPPLSRERQIERAAREVEECLQPKRRRANPGPRRDHQSTGKTSP